LFGFATVKFAMGSGEALGMPPATSSPEDADTQESDTMIPDGPPAAKHADATARVYVGKRKRCGFATGELSAFTNMTIVVKDVTWAIQVNKPTDMHHDLYGAVMDVVSFIEDALMHGGAQPPHRPQGPGYQPCWHGAGTESPLAKNLTCQALL
jgi:hypothetical protein